MTRFRKIAAAFAAAVLFLAVFAFDVVSMRIEVENLVLVHIREIAIASAMVLIYLTLKPGKDKLSRLAPKDMGRLLVVLLIVTAFFGAVSYLPSSQFTDVEARLIPASETTVFTAMLVSIASVILSLYILLTAKNLVMFKRKKGSNRNFVVLVILIILTSVTLLPVVASMAGWLGTVTYLFAVIMAVINSFRQGWIVFLSRREKVYSIIYSSLLMIGLVLLIVLFSNRTFISKAISYFSAPVERFALITMVFGASYYGMAFVSALFHLPTAEVYERKQSELSSLHNLSRLVTQVFDFQILVDTVTQMTREVTGARTAWLELVHRDADKGTHNVTVVSSNNVSGEQIEQLNGGRSFTLRDYLIETGRVLLIDEVTQDHRMEHIKGAGLSIGSILCVPLKSQDQFIGILNATSDVEYAFDQDDIDVLTTFADHVTIAIENSRLIAQSLERERYRQEMMVAQQMQRRLLPQEVPTHDMLEIAAVSEPSMEVGGDYYDFVFLDKGRVGVVVADVSGKGVTAAFYMAEVKGIFGSLSKLGLTPKEFVVKANQTIHEGLERNAFVSLLYAIFDGARSEVLLARAGHCPMLYVSERDHKLIKPVGLGLGLTLGDVFEGSIEEQRIVLGSGDVCIFYTDGITEARNEEGAEFGYDRLVDVARKNYARPADEIKEAVLSNIREFTGRSDLWDDLTLVVVKWRGAAPSRARKPNRSMTTKVDA